MFGAQSAPAASVQRGMKPARARGGRLRRACWTTGGCKTPVWQWCCGGRLASVQLLASCFAGHHGAAPHTPLSLGLCGRI